ncbi:MAG: sulfatase [Candidatus Omnitrophica bacterium]|nr:sulfatase [Candidatus Omnitrophota bacterium]MCM8768209.1 sulfatase [Candidatus Omnitrophota bacterium]
MNIVLIVFDSLRKDCIGAYGQPFWGKVFTPHFDAFAKEAIMFYRMFPESLPTLPARRALYTGRRVYPFFNGDFRLKGDFVGAAGWGPIPEEQPTVAELLREAGYRTALISDVYHMFKPSKNFWRGFDQWTFLRGQETDPARSGPRLTQEQIDYWLPKPLQNEWGIRFIQQCIMNMHDRWQEEEFFAPRVMREAARWLEQNLDAKKFFLVVESFDPHEPWLVPAYYRKMYLKEDGPEQVKSGYSEQPLDNYLLRRTQANYSGEVTMCDRWFGYLMESLKVMGLLDNTLVIFTTDHGHSIGDQGYLGKRGYPSKPEVYEVPLMIRLPKARFAGRKVNFLVQHHDLAATILEEAGVKLPPEIEGRPFLQAALKGRKKFRDHVTIGWSATPTVITEQWWLNYKADGTGVFLYELKTKGRFSTNVASKHPEVVKHLMELALADAGGRFPEWIVELARKQPSAPGCSDVAARV